MTIYDHLRNAEAELLAAAAEDTPAEYRMGLYEILLAVAELRGSLPHTVQWPEGSPKRNPLYSDPGIKPCGAKRARMVENVYVGSNISPEEIVKNLYVPYSDV